MILRCSENWCPRLQGAHKVRPFFIAHIAKMPRPVCMVSLKILQLGSQYTCYLCQKSHKSVAAFYRCEQPVASFLGNPVYQMPLHSGYTTCIWNKAVITSLILWPMIQLWWNTNSGREYSTPMTCQTDNCKKSAGQSFIHPGKIVSPSS